MIGSIIFAIVKEKGLCLLSKTHTVVNFFDIINCIRISKESDERSKVFNINDS